MKPINIFDSVPRFATGVFKDFSQTFTDVAAGIDKAFLDKDPMRWTYASATGIGLASLGIGIVARNPVSIALGAGVFSAGAGSFQIIGESARTYAPPPESHIG